MRDKLLFVARLAGGVALIASGVLEITKAVKNAPKCSEDDDLFLEDIADYIPDYEEMEEEGDDFFFTDELCCMDENCECHKDEDFNLDATLDALKESEKEKL